MAERGEPPDFEGTDRFEIRRRLGAGGMGVVYEAFDREREQIVALKTLRRFGILDAQALSRFKNEFRALHDIHHPNLVSLYELCEEDGACFFTMELVRGEDFLSHVCPPGSPSGDETQTAVVTESTVSSSAVTDVAPFSEGSSRGSTDTFRTREVAGPGLSRVTRSFDEPRLRAALAQLAAGIAALHAAGRVHRDVKPSNILVNPDGRVVLLDFGLVTAASRSEQSTQHTAVGTAAYMAPEQGISGEVGPAADWYSVGVILYQALTTRLPHRGRTQLETLMNKHKRPAAPPRQWNAGVPKDLDALCIELLDIDPGKRPPEPIILSQLGVEVDDTAFGVHASSSTGFTQTTPFVGRSEELSELRTAFDDSRTKPVVVIVEGESGLGKSELVRHFSQRLVDEVHDAVVLTSRCYERDSVAYKAFDGIAEELSRYMTHLPKVDAAALLPMQAGLLPRLFPVLQRVEAIASAPREVELPDPQEMRRQMFGALRELLARLARRCPLVLVIDDLQWTDTDSLLLLQEILSNAAAPNTMLIAATRPVGDEMRARILASVSAVEKRQIDLAAFSTEHAEELASLLLPSFDEEALGEIARESAGHPLFVMELARYAQGQGQTQCQGVTLEETLWQRISQLPAELLTLLEVLCIAGAPLTRETAANAIEKSPADLAKAASALRLAYLVRTGGMRKDDLIEPYHDRIREIVIKNLDDAARVHCHRRLAIALERGGAEKTAPQTLVRHAEAAGDSERAAQYAHTAAHHAVATMAFDQAAEFFRTALRLGKYQEEKQRELRFDLATALANAGRGPEAAGAFAAAADGAEPATRLRCQRHAAEQWLITGHIERGIEAIGELLAEIGESVPATPRRALLSVLWSRFRLRIRGLGWKERVESQVTRETLTRLDVLQAVAHGLALVDNVRGADFNARWLHAALTTGEAARLGVAIATEAVYQGSKGHRRNIDRARSLIENVQRIAEQKPDNPYLACWVVVVDGIVTYWEGRFAEADVLLEEADRQLSRLAGTTFELNNERVFRVACLRHLGALSRLHPLVDEYIRDAKRRGDLFLDTSLRRSVGRFTFLAKDEPEAALLDLERTSWTPPAGGFHLQHWYELEARGEIALYQGSAPTVYEELATSFEEMAGSLLLRVVSVRVTAVWLRARLLLSIGGSGPLAEASGLARKLGREQFGLAGTAAKLIHAAIASHTQLDSAVSYLKAAAKSAEENHLLLHTAVAHRRCGELVGGDEGAALIAKADEWMAGEGVKNPVRMCNVFAPGFPNGSREANALE